MDKRANLACTRHHIRHALCASKSFLTKAHPRNCPVGAYKEPNGGHLALTDAIKRTRRAYVSPTVFEGIGGVRIAVSHWATALDDDGRDFRITTDVLDEVMKVK